MTNMNNKKDKNNDNNNDNYSSGSNGNNNINNGNGKSNRNSSNSSYNRKNKKKTSNNMYTFMYICTRPNIYTHDNLSRKFRKETWFACRYKPDTPCSGLFLRRSLYHLHTGQRSQGTDGNTVILTSGSCLAPDPSGLRGEHSGRQSPR